MADTGRTGARSGRRGDRISPHNGNALDRRQFLVGAAGTAATAGLVGLGAAGLAGCSAEGQDGDGDDAEETEDGPAPVRRRVRYGNADRAVGQLWLPAPEVRPEGSLPVVTLIHGGFWRPQFTPELMEPLARAVTDAGWAAWNIDYRPAPEREATRNGEQGGWPTTFTDVAAAVDHVGALAEEEPLDAERVAVAGHAAGGTLALWTAARAELPADAPGSEPAVTPVVAASLAGINNLIAGAFQDLGSGAVPELMGDLPTGAGDAYDLASPAERLPIGVPLVLAHGEADAIVPPSQTTAFEAKATTAGDEATLILVDGADHFTLIDPEARPWTRVQGELRRRLG